MTILYYEQKNWSLPSLPLQKYQHHQYKYSSLQFISITPSSRLICNLGSVGHLSLSNSLYLHTKKMPRSMLGGSISTPKVFFGIDTGSSFLNHTVDGFLKIGAVFNFFFFNLYLTLFYFLIWDAWSDLFRLERGRWQLKRPSSVSREVF